MGAPIVHFEIIGRDAASLRAYYGELFGWEVDHLNSHGYGVVSGAGIGGGIGGTCSPDHDGHVTVYVGVPDVEAALARAEELGGKRLMGPDKVAPGVELGQFADPEGHVVGLLKAS